MFLLLHLITIMVVPPVKRRRARRAAACAAAQDAQEDPIAEEVDKDQNGLVREAAEASDKTTGKVDTTRQEDYKKNYTKMYVLVISVIPWCQLGLLDNFSISWYPTPNLCLPLSMLNVKPWNQVF